MRCGKRETLKEESKSIPMPPICFVVEAVLPLPPREIAGQMLDAANWTSFQGYGVLPGIREAVFEVVPPEVVGTRVRVTNTDGSRHVETIIEWRPDERVKLVMSEFRPPLSLLATQIVETWDFAVRPDATHVRRTFELHPRSVLARPALWLISLLLRRAVGRHLTLMREQGTAE